MMKWSERDDMEMSGRSTPSFIRDLECWRDSTGRLWFYSEPGDIWFIRDGDERTGNAVHASARSYYNLLKEFGPLKPDTVFQYEKALKKVEGNTNLTVAQMDALEKSVRDLGEE